MNKKIFCIFIILLLLTCSKTVFADTLSLEIIEGENSYNLLINEENTAFVKKIQNGYRHALLAKYVSLLPTWFNVSQYPPNAISVFSAER